MVCSRNIVSELDHARQLGIEGIMNREETRANNLQGGAKHNVAISKLIFSLREAMIENEELSKTVDKLLESYDILERKYFQIKKKNFQLQTITNALVVCLEKLDVSREYSPSPFMLDDLMSDKPCRLEQSRECSHKNSVETENNETNTIICSREFDRNNVQKISEKTQNKSSQSPLADHYETKISQEEFLQSPSFFKLHESQVKVHDNLQKSCHGGAQERQIFNKILSLTKNIVKDQPISRYSTEMVPFPSTLEDVESCKKIGLLKEKRNSANGHGKTTLFLKESIYECVNPKKLFGLKGLYTEGVPRKCQQLKIAHQNTYEPGCNLFKTEANKRSYGGIAA